jgi:DNA-binding CsgD family transcriptional regulator
MSGAHWMALVATLGLSKREEQMLRHANYDDSVSSLATKLGISPHTVRTYRDRLYRKLGVCSLCQAIAVLFATYVAVVNDEASVARPQAD